MLDNKKVKEIENYYKKCVDDGATYEDIEASKKAMSSMEIILGEPSRLERLATDIHNHYVASCAGDPDRIQKAIHLSRLSGETGHIRLEIKFCSMKVEDLEMFYIII